MSRRFYDLPPLTTLAAFEAAARHLSFKNAAAELNVTPGAVSHQIKALEAELGAPLFLRRHRGVVLTDEGNRLFATLAQSFVSISQRLREIRGRQAQATVTVGASTAVASLWMTRLLSEFWREHEQIQVDQSVSDHGFADAPEIDMFVRYGRETSPLWEHHPLYRDELVPVASPEMAERLGGTELADLAQERLIYLDSVDQSWTRWQDWFAALDHAGPVRRGHKVNNYTIALQAAQDGVGLLLGWRRLINPLLREGRLVVVGPHALPAPRRFHLVTRPADQLSDNALILRDWLIGRLSGMGEVNSSQP